MVHHFAVASETPPTPSPVQCYAPIPGSSLLYRLWPGAIASYSTRINLAALVWALAQHDAAAPQVGSVSDRLGVVCTIRAQGRTHSAPMDDILVPIVISSHRPVPKELQL